jgi:hypothetical protein
MGVWSRLPSKGAVPSARSGHTLVWHGLARDDLHEEEGQLAESRGGAGHLYLFGGCDAASGSHSAQPFYRYALGTCNRHASLLTVSAGWISSV